MSFRICSTVLINDDGHAVQSYRFGVKRLLGNLRKVLKFLDIYEVDEIHAIVPIKGDPQVDPASVLLGLSDISISTPLGIGGGISDESIAQMMQDPFFERCIFNSAIFDNETLLQKVRQTMGRQSMVASIPFIVQNGSFMVYHSKSDVFKFVKGNFWNRVKENFNEIILLDAESEGSKNGFDFSVLDDVDFPIERTLISGGLTKSDINKAQKMNLAGVSIDNFTLYSEYSIGSLR